MCFHDKPNYTALYIISINHNLQLIKTVNSVSPKKIDYYIIANREFFILKCDVTACTITGETADLTAVPQTVISARHKKGELQKAIPKNYLKCAVWKDIAGKLSGMSVASEK